MMTPTMERIYQAANTEPTVFECPVRQFAVELAALGIAYQTVEITMLGKGAMTLRFKRDESANI